MSRIKCINNFCFHIFLFLFFFLFHFRLISFLSFMCATSYYYDFLSQYLKTSVTLQSTTCTWIIIIVIKTNTKFEHNVVKEGKEYKFSLPIQTYMYKNFLFHFKLRSFCRECHFVYSMIFIFANILKGVCVPCWFFFLFHHKLLSILTLFW